jgi:hypothetical protein
MYNMGVSLNSYKKYLKQIIKETIAEMFDSTAIKTSFNFIDREDYIETEEFKDYKDNTIKVLFYKLKNNICELDYSVNGSSFTNPDLEYTIKDYSILLNTIAKAVDQFLIEYKPLGLVIEGADYSGKLISNPKSLGQKNRIYDYFISQLEDNPNYKTDKSKSGIINLIRRDN